MLALAHGGALTIIDDAWLLARELARILDAPHLELRVQEGNHWDFTLYCGNNLIADFSTNVAYFNADSSAPRPWKQGNAELFSRTWNVPLARVAPYLIDWESLPAPEYVISGDHFPTGDWQQVFDFMQAIGVEAPHDNPDAFEFSAPCWQMKYVTQPWWCRVVRQISVWTKGTYPDVPRLTREQREEWERRRSSIRIVRVSLGDPKENDEEA